MPRLIEIARATAKEFSRDQCTLRAAALSYYTVFALPPLLILLIMMAGLIWTPDAVQRAIESQFAGLIGVDGARTVREMVSSAHDTTHGAVATTLGVAGLLIGATGAFLSLQDALNAVWEVKPDPRQGGIKRFVTKRLLSAGMLLGVAFLLVVSLAVTAAISALGNAVGSVGAVMQVLNLVLSVTILSILFAAMFKYLPDAVVAWRSVWLGGAVTAVLLEVGKSIIGLYLGHSHPGNAFGGASALAVILVWIYYSGTLVLFGAEFTQAVAASLGHSIEPKAGAIRVVREEHTSNAPAPGPAAQGAST